MMIGHRSRRTFRAAPSPARWIRLPLTTDVRGRPGSYDRQVRTFVQSWRDRFRADRSRGLPVADVVLSVGLALVAVASTIAGLPPEGSHTVTIPAAVLMTAPLALRRRLPIVVCATVMAAATAQSLLTVPPGSLWAFAAFLVITYSAAAHRSEGMAAIGGALVVAGLFLQEWLAHTTDYVFVVLVFAGTWLLGRAVRTWRMRAVTAETEADNRARLAVAEERLRLARDLHDSVAHALAVIAVQAQAAEAALARDPSLAQAPVAAIAGSARTALEEMRSTLGVLRGDEPADPAEDGGPAGAVERILASARAAGLDVETDLRGLDGEQLPPAIAAVWVRVVQESLTNALKHGRGSARLSVGREPVPGGDLLCIEVVNPVAGAQPGSGTGHGLLGLRERLHDVGGKLVASAGDGYFRLSATVPLAATPPPTQRAAVPQPPEPAR